MSRQESLTQKQLQAAGFFSDEAAAVTVAGIPTGGIRGYDQQYSTQSFMLSR